MKICILAIANPFHWVGPYVSAFRAMADVLTVGPPFGVEYLAGLGLPERKELLQPNDIESNLGRDVVLADLFPPGWVPDLIVAISNFGRPLSPDMSGLPCPRIYLSIDTWQSPLDYIDALYYDFVFAAQRSFVESLRATGSRNVSWLPLACDPEAHFPTGTCPTADVSFAGALASTIHNRRSRLLDALDKHVTLHRKANVFGAAYRDAICAGKLTFNHAAVDDLNMRIFEALAMEVPLLTNRGSDANGLSDLFVDGEHVIIYDDESDLLERVDYYLAHPDEARAIAEAGRREVRARHTYAHRVQQILETVAGSIVGFPDALPHPAGEEAFLIDKVPRDVKSLLDMDRVLGPHIPALRARGVNRVYGTAGSTPTVDAPWDRIVPEADLCQLAFDAALISKDEMHRDTPLDRVAQVARHLPCGGVLLVCLTEQQMTTLAPGQDFGSLPALFRARDCHLMYLHVYQPDEDDSRKAYLLIARKREQRILDVVEAGLARIEVPYQEVRDWVSRLPADQ